MLDLNQRAENRDPITGEETPMVAGRTGALPTTSAPPTSGGTADVSGAPLSGNQATESQVGGTESSGGGFDPTNDRGPVGSSIRDKTTQNPDMVTQAASDSLETVKNVRANDNGQSDIQMQRINEQLGPKNTAKAKDQAIEQYNDGVDLAVKDGKLTKRQALKQKVKFKNAFNKIKDEEMGLFLMDFGMRMMVAGEEMGSMGAIGAAGMGAMGALQGRRETEAAQTLEADRYEREFGLDERRVGALEKQADASATRAETAAGGYRGEKAYLMELGRSQGFSEGEMLQMFSGGELPNVRFQKWMDFVGKTVEKAIADPSMLPNKGLDPVTGKKYSEFGPEDMKAWAQRMVEQEQAYSAFSRAQRGALGE